MAHAHLSIDLGKIEHNTRTLVDLCGAHGMEVLGVTKGVCGHPGVARAMLRGGVRAIGDSRLENIRRLRGAGIDTYYVMLRLPPLSAAAEVVAAVDLSLNSERAVVEALSRAAVRQRKVHDVMLMVDLGDRREGLLPGDVIPLAERVCSLPGLHLKGLGGNLACLGGVVPSTDNMTRLVELARGVERSCGIELQWISGVNSSGLELMAAGGMPEGVNHARIGEAILLGRETVHRRPWPGTAQDAFLLHAEILELKTKPSLPSGDQAENAFGETPVFEDRGEQERGLANIGREDVSVDGLTPLDEDIRIVGATSGYLVLDATAAAGRVKVGDELGFRVNYAALVSAMTSEYVGKCPSAAGPASGGVVGEDRA